MNTEITNAKSMLITDLEDLRIRSVLDAGFFAEFQTTPEIHAHSYFELMIVLEGKLTLKLSDGTLLCAEEGELCLIPPMVYHSTCSDHVKKLALRFYCEQLPNFQGESSMMEVWNTVRIHLQAATVLTNAPTLCKIFQELRQEISSPRLASATYIRALLTQFYIDLLRKLSSGEDNGNLADQTPDEQELRRLRIEEYLLNHYREQIVEEDLAKYMNFSRRQVSRILRQMYGMSFRRLLIDARLHRAEQLLLTTNYSIEQIAEMVGYTSLSGFYAAFQQKFKTSAGKYRQISKPGD